MDHVNYILVLLIGLLCALAAVAGLVRRFAYPIVFCWSSDCCACCSPHVPCHRHLRLVFLVILPSLFYTAAWQTSWREFKYNLVSLSSLAVLLVFFTAFGVAFVAKGWLPGFNWRLRFLLGAVFSPLQDRIDFLSERRKSAKGEHEVHLYEDLPHHYQHGLEDIDEWGTDGSNLEKTSHDLTTNHLLLETIWRQRKELNLLQSNGRIGDNVHRNLERELDLKESLLT